MCRASALVLLAACGRSGFDARVDAAAGDVPAGDVPGGDAPAQPVTRVAMAELPETSPPTSIDVPIPAGLAIGDLVVIGIYANLDTAQLTPPSGWDPHLNMASTVHQFRAGMFSHRVAVGDPPTASFALASSGNIAWGLGVYRGVGSVDIDTSMLFDGTMPASTEIFDIPSVTTPVDGELVMVMIVNDGGYTSGTWTPPAGTTAFANSLRIGAFDRTFATAGATGDFVAMITASNPTGGAGGAYWIVALRP
jgi:hypothetical protein